jgi:hypothetical protein
MLYIITDGSVFKLGYSKDPLKRLKELQTSSSKPLSILVTTPGDLKDEKYYHKQLCESRLVGEWFTDSDTIQSIIYDWRHKKTPVYQESILSKIYIHKAKTKNLWFKAADCCKLLNIRTDNLLKRKGVSYRFFPSEKANFLNEKSFRLVFKSDLDLLAELDCYKSSGTFKTGSSYSNLLSTVYLYIMNSSGTTFNMPGFPHPIEKAKFKELLVHDQVASEVVLLYCNILFFDPPNTSVENDFTLSISKIVRQLMPVDIDLKSLYDYKLGKSIPIWLVKSIQRADININVNIDQLRELTEMQGITKKILTLACDNALAVNKCNPKFNYFQYPLENSHDGVIITTSLA